VVQDTEQAAEQDVPKAKNPDVYVPQLPTICPPAAAMLPEAATQFACEVWPWPSKLASVLPSEPFITTSGAHRFRNGALLVNADASLWLLGSCGTSAEIVVAKWSTSDKFIVSAPDGAAAAVQRPARSQSGKSLVMRWNAHAELVFSGLLDGEFFALDDQGVLYGIGLPVAANAATEVMAYTPDGKLSWTTKAQGLSGLIAMPGGGLVVVESMDVASLRRYDGSGKLVLETPLHYPMQGPFSGAVFSADPHGGLIGLYQGGYGPGAPPIVLFRLTPGGQLHWTQALFDGSGFLPGLDPLAVMHANAMTVMDSYGYVSNAGSNEAKYVRRWNTEGRPVAFLPGPEFSWGLLSTLPTPDGGFLDFGPHGVRRYNALGDGTCPGCGPPQAACSDGDPCTADACSAHLGSCTHTPIAGCKKSLGTCIVQADCDDGEPCTGDSCDAKTGGCSHVAQTTCLLSNFCAGKPSTGAPIVGQCIAGRCVPPPEPMCEGNGAPAEGWLLGLDAQRPQVREAGQGDLLVAGGWVALRVQDNGVVRWRRVMDGGIGASARTVSDGLLATITQPPAQAKPGFTRLARLSAAGQPELDVTVATGLDDWWLGHARAKRRQWLLSRPGGGHVLLGHKAWGAAAWHGRMVVLSEDSTVTLAVDVTLTGMLGDPNERGIDQVWPAADGGLLLAWHQVPANGQSRYGVARLGADGKVQWQKLLAPEVHYAAFDPWRPLGLARKVKSDPQLLGFLIDQSGVGPLLPSPIGAVTALPGGLPANDEPLSAYAELPGTMAVAELGYGPVGKNWPPEGPATSPLAEVYKMYFKMGRHDAQDLWVTASGRVVTLIYGEASYPTLLVRGKNGEFRLCAKPMPAGQKWSECQEWPCKCTCDGKSGPCP